MLCGCDGLMTRARDDRHAPTPHRETWAWARECSQSAVGSSAQSQPPTAGEAPCAPAAATRGDVRHGESRRCRDLVT